MKPLEPVLEVEFNKLNKISSVNLIKIEGFLVPIPFEDEEEPVGSKVTGLVKSNTIASSLKVSPRNQFNPMKEAEINGEERKNTRNLCYD